MNKRLNKCSRMIVSLVVILSCWSILPGSPAMAATYRFVTLEYPPYEYSENGIIKGAAVEILRETFKLMGHEVKIEIYPWARSIELFKNGKVDGIFTFFKTAERENFTFYSGELIVQQKIVFWVNKNSKITFDGDFSKLKNYRIGVVRKTSYGDRFDTAVKNGILNVTETYTIEEAINLLVNNRIDIWVSNYDGGLFALKKTGNQHNARALTPSLQDMPAYVGFSKKRNLEGLKNSFDAALEKLKRSGKYASILKAYSN